MHEDGASTRHAILDESNGRWEVAEKALVRAVEHVDYLVSEVLKNEMQGQR